MWGAFDVFISRILHPPMSHISLAINTCIANRDFFEELSKFGRLEALHICDNLGVSDTFTSSTLPIFVNLFTVELFLMLTHTHTNLTHTSLNNVEILQNTHMIGSHDRTSLRQIL